MSGFTTINDVKRYVSRQIENYDMSCYAESFDELVDLIAEQYVTYLQDHHHWTYGEDVPEIFTADWNRIFQCAE